MYSFYNYRVIRDLKIPPYKILAKFYQEKCVIKEDQCSWVCLRNRENSETKLL